MEDALSKAAQAAQEKSWSECGLEEKVERLRHALLSLAGQADVAGRLATEAHEIVMLHDHHPLKGLMRPVQAGNAWANESQSSRWSDHPLKHLLRLLT